MKRTGSTSVVLLAGLATLVVMGLAFLGFVLSVINREVDLRADIEAHQESNEASFDTMFKILQQKAGIVSKYKDDFKDIWPELIAGRYNDNAMMQWVQERNPNFDSGLYKDLMASVEAERKSFLRDQKDLRQKKSEHDKLRKRPVSGMVLSMFGDNSEVEVTIVTSETTQNTFTTKEENDIELFKE